MATLVDGNKIAHLFCYLDTTIASCVHVIQNSINLSMLLQFIEASILIIVWLNLSNDVFDADTGVDLKGRKSESILNLVKFSKHTILSFAILCIVFGIIWFCNLTCSIRASARFYIFTFLLCALIFGYIYQAPPLRFSYMGFGEPLCFMSFGPLVTLAFYLSFSFFSTSMDGGLIPISLVALSLLVGSTTVSILFSSHFHQKKGDFITEK